MVPLLSLKRSRLKQCAGNALSSRAGSVISAPSMKTSAPLPGQRWVSDTEPELGLGIVLRAEVGRVEVLFAAANVHRQYALKSAPLRRVQFKDGERIKLHDGANVVVESVEERAGLLVYRSATRAIAESELCDTISFSTPE